MGDPAPLVTFEVHNATASTLELRQWQVLDDGSLARDAGSLTDRDGRQIPRMIQPGAVQDVLVQAGDRARLEAFDGDQQVFCQVYDLKTAKQGTHYQIELQAGHFGC